MIFVQQIDHFMIHQILHHNVFHNVHQNHFIMILIDKIMNVFNNVQVIMQDQHLDKLVQEIVDFIKIQNLLIELVQKIIIHVHKIISINLDQMEKNVYLIVHMKKMIDINILTQ